MSHEVFDTTIHAWLSYQASPRGRLRTQLLLENTLRAAPDEPGQVLDVGAGTGELGYALARAGHQVTLTDFSPAMLSIARERLSDYPVAFDKLDLSADHSLLAEPRFDLIACHNVIEYLAGPQRAAGLARLVRALLPRGVLSLAFGNAHHAPLQSAIVKHDFERACRELAAGAPESTSIFGTPTYVMNLDEVHSHLGSHNMAVHAVHGIRCATDLLDEHTVAEQSYEALLTLERALTLQTAYVGMARFVQVIAIKRPA